MTITGFLDTNILVNWVFMDAALQTPNADRRELFDLLGRKVPSYKLLQRVKTDKELHGTLVTSHLAYAEIFTVLLDQYVEDRMHAMGIPASDFSRERLSVQLTAVDATQIAKQITHLSNSYFREPNLLIRYVADEYDYVAFASLIAAGRLQTYDAILVATALHEKCGYFITEDTRLREAVKKLESELSITPISAQAFSAKLPPEP